MAIKFPLRVVKSCPPAIPETIAISLVKVCPVVIKLPLKVSTFPLNAGSLPPPPAIPETIDISESKKFPLDIKLSVAVWPVVIKFPLTSSITDPVATKLDATVFMLLVRVVPVFTKSPIIPAICPSLLVIWVCKLLPVEIKFHLRNLCKIPW